MKKKLVVLLIVICMAAAGCGSKDGVEPSGGSVTDEPEIPGSQGTEDEDKNMVPDAEGPAGNTDGSATNTDGQIAGTDGQKADTGEEEPVDGLTLRIVDGAETGNLILAGEGAGEVYTLSVEGVKILLDGVESAPALLEDGMLVEIQEPGAIMETFPAQFSQVGAIYAYGRGTEQNPMGTYYDLCGLYLQVLNDLWDVDSGLNGGAVYVSVDLSEAPGELTEGEKNAVAWIFAGEHGAEALTLTYQELAEQGYLSEYGEFGDEEHKAYEWADGVLFSITADESGGNEVFSLPVLKFDAEKWRSPLGGYFFEDCKAVWSESGSWGSYSVGAEAIS